MNIVYPDAGAPAEEVLSTEQRGRLDGLGTWQVFVNRPADEQEFIERVQGAQALLLGWDLPPAVMEAASELQLIAFTGIGVSSYVDLKRAAELGITVCNTPGYADITVAEHALALLLSVARRIPSQDRSMQQGAWQPESGVELFGKQLGVIGYGGIGQRMAALGTAIGMTVVAWTPRPERHRAIPGVQFVTLEHLLSTSDALSIHIAHTPETTALLDANALEQVRPGTLLVNTARGAIVDEAALLDALNEGRIRGAALDVFTTEPTAPNDALATHPNVVCTPHSAYHTPEATQRIHELAIDAIEAYAAGTPINTVTGA